MYALFFVLLFRVLLVSFAWFESGLLFLLFVQLAIVCVHRGREDICYARNLFRHFIFNKFLLVRGWQIVFLLRVLQQWKSIEYRYLGFRKHISAFKLL